MRPSSYTVIYAAAAAALPIILFAIVTVVLLNRLEQRSIEQALRQMAQSSLNVVDREITNDLSALEALATAKELDTGQLEEFRNEAERLVLSRPHWLNLRLTDPVAHRQLLNVNAPRTSNPPPTIDPASEDQVKRTGRPTISAVRKPALPEQQHFIMLRVPVERGNEISYTLAASVSLKVFSQVLQEQMPPPQWTVAIIDQNYIIAGRNHGHHDFIGTPAPPSLTNKLSKIGESFFFADNKEGERAYTFFLRSPLSGWTIAVGVPGEVVDAPLRHSMLALTGGGSLALVIAAIITAFIQRNFAAREAAERRLLALEAERKTQHRLSEVAANFPGLIYRRVLHTDGRISYPFVSDNIRSLINTSPEDVQALQDLTELGERYLLPEDRDLWWQAIHHSAKTLTPFTAVVRIRLGDSHVRWLHSMSNTRRDEDGSVVWDGVVMDITELKETEARLEAALQDKDSMLQEIHHRVRNNLQVMASLVQLEALQITDPLANQRLEIMGRRIAVFGRIHEQLYLSGSLAIIDFAESLRQICSSMDIVHMPDPAVSLAIDAESKLYCGLDTAIPLALIAHELITNAIQHAFPAGRAGKVDIGLRRNHAGDVELSIVDDGIGLSIGHNPGWANMGLTLVETLAEQLNAKLHISSGQGTAAIITLPGTAFPKA